MDLQARIEKELCRQRMTCLGKWDHYVQIQKNDCFERYETVSKDERSCKNWKVTENSSHLDWLRRLKAKERTVHWVNSQRKAFRHA